VTPQEPEDYLFRILTPLGFRIHVTSARWDLISTIKHPALRNRHLEVSLTLETPDEIRRSRHDETVLLFYRQVRPARWICAVVKLVEGNGFLITAYPASSVKAGEHVWIR